jgi:hypothetical protein
MHQHTDAKGRHFSVEAPSPHNPSPMTKYPIVPSIGQMVTEKEVMDLARDFFSCGA